MMAFKKADRTVWVNCYIFPIVIHAKYYPVSDWLKPHA